VEGVSVDRCRQRTFRRFPRQEVPVPQLNLVNRSSQTVRILGGWQQFQGRLTAGMADGKN
jgi:hypothetical protein